MTEFKEFRLWIDGQDVAVYGPDTGGCEVNVIEKSAYDLLKFQNEKLHAENAKLAAGEDEKVNHRKALELVTNWRNFWMGQNSYMGRAVSIDENMRHDLARRIAEAAKSGDLVESEEE